MMNRKIILTLGCLLVVGLLWLFTKESDLSHNESQTSESRSSNNQLETVNNSLEQHQSQRVIQVKKNSSQFPISARAKLREEYKLDLEKDNAFDKKSSFKFIGGKVEKILNAKGEIILQSTEEEIYHKIRVSTSNDAVVAVAGRGKSRVVDKTGELLAILPKSPAQGQINFGSWHWVSDDVLVGDSGDLIPHKHDPEKHGAEGTCEGCYAPLTSNTRLYTFNVETKEMGEVALPEQLQGKRFTILRAVYDGTLEIASEEESYVGWVKINVTE